LDFRERTIRDFAVVFNGTSESGDTITTDDKFAQKWGWFGVMYRLTNGEIVNLQSITKLSLYECLTWLTYEVDLNETKKVNR
tara:strand:+ start:28 stop:273 length:246 start_codon:yes stop_codon:yes gene_type:complete